MPVWYVRGGANPWWKPLAFGEIKELPKAAQEYGRDSPYLGNLVQGTLSAHMLTHIPHLEVYDDYPAVPCWIFIMGASMEPKQTH